MSRSEVNKPNSSPLISVIVTIYNNERYLESCLDSLLTQTFQDFEIVVIDDGSTDQTAKILDQYQTNSRIIIHRQSNAGISAARNQGLKLSRGKFVCFVDSDDYVAKNYLEKLVAPLLQDSTIDITVCGYQEIYQDHQTNYPLKPQLLTGYQATKNLLLNQRDFDVLAWNKLYKKSLFTEHDILYPVGQIHEDNLTTYKLYSVAKNVQYLKDQLYFYQRKNSRITKDFSSTEKTLKRLQVKEQMAIEAQKYFKTPDLKYAAEIALLLSYFAFIDNSITHHIDGKYFNIYRQKVRDLLDGKSENAFLTPKLRFYISLLISPLGFLYQIFRKITLKKL